jgi:hypothetical protein
LGNILPACMLGRSRQVQAKKQQSWVDGDEDEEERGRRRCNQLRLMVVVVKDCR